MSYNISGGILSRGDYVLDSGTADCCSSATGLCIIWLFYACTWSSPLLLRWCSAELIKISDRNANEVGSVWNPSQTERQTRCYRRLISQAAGAWSLWVGSQPCIQSLDVVCSLFNISPSKLSLTSLHHNSSAACCRTTLKFYNIWSTFFNFEQFILILDQISNIAMLYVIYYAPVYINENKLRKDYTLHVNWLTDYQFTIYFNQI